MVEYITRFQALFVSEQDLLTATVWVRDNLSTKITGAGGDHTGKLNFQTLDTSFNDMVSTIVAVKTRFEGSLQWYNFEMKVQ